MNCAVGQLLVDSGAGALARSIAARFEYARVAEIDEPALLQWADENGFSVTDLAMIQPSYTPPPTPDSVRESILARTDSLTRQCASEWPPPRAVTLDVTLDARGTTTVAAKERDAFSTCFASLAGGRHGGAASGPAKTGRFTLRIRPSPPQALFEKAFDDVFGAETLVTKCLPRAGVAPSHAVFTASASKSGFVVWVKTTPENLEVERCLWEEARVPLKPFATSPVKLSLRRERALVSFGSTFDASNLRSLGQLASITCRAPVGVSFALGVTARAASETFDVVVTGGDPVLRACVEREVERGLRRAFTVRTEASTDYFRIDSDVFLATQVETMSIERLPDLFDPRHLP